MQNSISFRYEVSPADCQTVRAIVASTGFFSQEEIDVAVELVEERLAKGPPSGYHFVFAERDGQVLGYTCYGPIALTAASYDLFWIAVDQAHQGQKIGKILLAKSEELIRAAGGRQVYIETSNRGQYASTRGFYLRCGYQEVAVMKDFYDIGDDKVIYERVLES
jgi:ribosomal protein S18 acetylase RimI-like enzyme